MADQVFNVTIKGIGDFSDVVSNVNSVQKALTKLKIPDKLGNNLSQNISNFMREYDKYQQKVAGGIKTQGDNNAVNRNLSSMLSSYQKIVDNFNKLTPKDFKEIFKLDEGAFASITNKIKEVQAELDKIRIDPEKITGPIEQIKSLTKSDKIVGENGFLEAFKKGLTEGDDGKGLVKAREALTELENHYARFSSQMTRKETKTGWESALKSMRDELEAAERRAAPLTKEMAELNGQLNTTGAKGMSAFNGVKQDLDKTKESAEKVTTALKNMHDQEFSFNRQVQMIDRQVQSYFGLSQMIRKVGNIAKSAFNTVKELDKAMTATAVVTNFKVGDMWNMLPTYTEQANKLGATIKDVYDATTLYYQQGLNTEQAMGLSEETLKMARIAGMDAAQATDMMTAALRGFNMEINQTSAQKVNDIYSKLAAVTASDTKELGTAMEKTASLANSANMKIETTSAFLAQMIETTREAPENLGTAMKTIIARFQEMKKDPTKLVDSEGVAMDVNKVDTALKSIGVQLTNTQGEFRNLDDVFLEISKKWDSLTQGQQRYIATTAAGSRQQSRFIAMMSNYERTMELVNEANNSAGASQKQFEKTMESMDSKLNQLKNAWNQFAMGLMNNQILKSGVTGVTKFLDAVNKLIDTLSKIPPKPFEGLTKSALTLGATLVGLNSAKKWLRGSIMAGAGWWRNEGTIRDNFMAGYGKPQRLTPLELYNKKAEQKGLQKQEPTVETKTNVVATVGTVDTSSVDGVVDSSVKSEIEDGPPIVAKTTVQPQAQVDTSRYGNQVTFQRGEDGKLFVPKSSDVTTLPPVAPGTEQNIENAGNAAKTAKENFNGLGSSIAGAGYLLQRFGDKLGPFGGIISSTGSLLMGFGTTLGTIAAKAADAGGGLKGLASAAGSVLGPMGLIVGVAIAIGFAVWALDKAFESDAERIERLTNSAKAASEAYSSLKQEASELTSSLEQIKSNEESFEGLVAGTTEFNEKLTEQNQQIDELLQKYPELNDPKYLSTDKNGLKHINQEGIDFIKQQQNQLVDNASALNIISNANLKAEQERQEAKRLENELKFKQSSKVSKKSRDQEQIMTEDEYREYREQIASNPVDSEEIKNLKEKIKYHEEIADSAEKTAKQQAIAASLTKVEVGDRDRLASMYIDNLEATEKRAEADLNNRKKMLQTYADYYGYTYEEESNKILNGTEEVEVNEEDLKSSFPTMSAILELQPSIENFDKIENDLNQKFSKGLKLGASSGDNVLSGVLSGDIETDPTLVRKLAKKPVEKIEKTLSELDDAEVAAAMGIKEEDYVEGKDELVKEYAAKIKDNAQKTFEAQAQVYDDLGAKIAKSRGISSENIDTSDIPDGLPKDLSTRFKQYEDNTKQIAKEIEGLSLRQVNTLNNIGEKIEENVGSSVMDTFFKDAFKIYKGKGGEEFNKILKSIDWESSSSRLKGYTKAIKSANSSIQKFGTDMKQSAAEANLVGDAFDEFVSGDWVELSEKADDFKNSLGEIDGAGILKAAEQSSSLKDLLDSGAVSATAVATALQGIESGKYSIHEVDSTVLQLISSFTRLEDASLRAHNTISNFDPGIDTGEGEDFIKDNAEKAKEYYDNGEWGNQQLESYIKAAAGEKRWNKALKAHKGDLHATTRELMKYVTTFEDGFVPAWKQIYKGEDIEGNSLDKKIKDFAKGDVDLEKRLKQFEVVRNGDKVGFKIGDLSTGELKTYFEEIYGVSEQYADLMLQNLLNYSGTLKRDLQKNDLREAVQSEDFRKGRTDKEGKNLILTDAELRAFRKNGGNVQQLAIESGYTDTVNKKTGKVTETAEEKLLANRFKVFDKKSSKRRDDYKNLYADYIEARGKDIFADKELKTGKKLDLNKLMDDAASWSMDDEQAMHMAFKAYRKGEKKGQATLYEGVEVESGITNYEDFVAAIEEMTETSQWVQVGETIGQQIVNALTTAKFLEDLRSGEGKIGGAFKENSGETTASFQTVIDQIKSSGEDKQQQKEDITTYLSQSKELFDSLKPEEQAQALDGVVNKLNELNFKPEEITAAIKDGLGVDLNKGPEKLLTGKAGEVEIDKALVEKQLSDLKANISTTEVASKAVDMAKKAFSSLTAGITGVITTISTGVKGGNLATGQNNPNSAFHRVGTMARGSRGGYTISGRPTLTGEEGEELVWEPKRNEAYMVGSKGPQFANISKDAVVWNADQTKRIKKNSNSIGRIGTGARGIIPFGTMAGGTGGLKISGIGSMDIIGKITDFVVPEGNGKEKAPAIETSALIKELKVKEGIEAVKADAEAVVDKVEKNGQISGEPVKVDGIIEAKTVTKETPKKETKTTKTIETKIDGKAQKQIDNVKSSNTVTIQTKANTEPAKKAIKGIQGKDVYIKVYPKYEGTWEHTVKAKVEKVSTSGGSSAKGRYGTVGPEDKGGLTLTGEKGFEIAWLPSENRSMILGAGGPQMVDLPSDAVVYTHEQSKDIIKRKGIPAGSHADKDKVSTSGMGWDTPSKKKKEDKKNTGKVSKKGDKKDKKTTNKAEKVVDKAGKVSVWWENQTRKVDAVQRKVDKTLKEFEKAVGTVGTTYKTAKKSINNYTKKLNKSIDLNNQSIKRANDNLKKADKSTKKSTSISWDVKKGKKTVKKSSKISLSKFISYDSGLDTYVINQNAINGVAKKSKNKAQAIKDAAQKLIEDNLSKRNTGIDNVEKSREALEKLADDVYKTFFSWENSLNKIYLLSQKLENLNSRLEVRQSNEELIETRATAGFGRENDFERLQNILKEEETIMERQLEGNKANLTASAQAYESSLQLSTYAKRYAKAPDSLEAKNDFNAAKLALQFLKDTGLNTSDTFNYEKAVAELEKKELPEDTINRMKDVLEKINENRSNLVNAENETFTSATAIYQKLSEYQDFITEFEKDLLSGLEEQTEKEIDKLDKLNSSLSEAYKKLLDEVKQRLDERRQSEDNAKTEQDISQKQQRLAMLRADTSGGHKTEIAQLEKEIAEAQQNYGRTLEDQLVNNLQQQSDKAEEQRQRQIELLQAQQEISKITGKNLDEVKKLLEEGNEEQIKNAWLSAKGYDDALPDEKESLENEWDAAWTKYQAYSNEATQLKAAIESNKSLSDIEEFVSNIDKTLSQKVGNDIKSFKASSGTAKEARLAGFKAENLKGTYTNKEIVGAGYKKADLAKAGITAKNLKSNKISAEVAKAAGFTAKELGENKYTLKELVKAGYGLKDLTSAGYTTGGIAKAAKELKMKPEAIAKKYGAAVALKADVSGAAVQKTLGTSTSAIQKIINENKKDAATQTDLAKTKANLDINGKKKGGVVKGTVNASGKTATANKGSTLYSQKINTKTGKTTGEVTKKTIDKLTSKDFDKNKKEATDALISAIKNKKVGSKINKEMKSLVTKAGIVGKYYKLQNGVQGSIGSNGKIYYNTKDGVKIWNAATGNIGSDKYDKNSYLKKALKNDAISREYAQVLINKKAFTKPQLQSKGVKKFASGGLADFTGPAWLDGTPTKPEVVLSAADTKNFIMLRDVLSKAMGSSGSTENSYANTEFNININIEKVADDYDVDKIITKVKKEITKSAGYRNVTQVRSFR